MEQILNKITNTTENKEVLLQFISEISAQDDAQWDVVNEDNKYVSFINNDFNKMLQLYEWYKKIPFEQIDNIDSQLIKLLNLNLTVAMNEISSFYSEMTMSIDDKLILNLLNFLVDLKNTDIAHTLGNITENEQITIIKCIQQLLKGTDDNIITIYCNLYKNKINEYIVQYIHNLLKQRKDYLNSMINNANATILEKEVFMVEILEIINKDTIRTEIEINEMMHYVLTALYSRTTQQETILQYDTIEINTAIEHLLKSKIKEFITNAKKSIKIKINELSNSCQKYKQALQIERNTSTKWDTSPRKLIFPTKENSTNANSPSRWKIPQNLIYPLIENVNVPRSSTVVSNSGSNLHTQSSNLKNKSTISSNNSLEPQTQPHTSMITSTDSKNSKRINPIVVAEHYGKPTFKLSAFNMDKQIKQLRGVKTPNKAIKRINEIKTTKRETPMKILKPKKNDKPAWRGGYDITFFETHTDDLI